MVAVARAVGVLVFGLGVLGLLATVLTLGLDRPAPLWSDQAWTAEARRFAEWIGFALLMAVGLALRARPKQAVWPMMAVVVLAGLRIAYDFAVSDPDLDRHKALLMSDLALCAALAVAVFSQLLAEDEEADRDRRETDGETSS
jgi:hypothetical protein